MLRQSGFLVQHSANRRDHRPRLVPNERVILNLDHNHYITLDAVGGGARAQFTVVGSFGLPDSKS